MESLVLSNDDFISSISLKLSRDLSQSWSFSDKKLYTSILKALNIADISKAIEMDLNAVISRDPATNTVLETFLFSKGFSALQAYREHLIIIGKTKIYCLIFFKAGVHKFMA